MTTHLITELFMVMADLGTRLHVGITNVNWEDSQDLCVHRHIKKCRTRFNNLIICLLQT